MKIKNVLILLVIILTAMGVFYQYGRIFWRHIYTKMAGRETVASVIDKIGEGSRSKLSAKFAEHSLTYPPKKIALLVFKDTKQLELWDNSGTTPVFVANYQVLKASGVKGPKLREGDRQVPEGIYRIEGLNPNSSYHLSMKLNYPNAFDLKYAKQEGRTHPGTNIFIHGKAVSIGCLAMGDSNIEELFTLVHDVGKENVAVIIAPTDPRLADIVPDAKSPIWVGELYEQITREIKIFQTDEDTSKQGY